MLIFSVCSDRVELQEETVVELMISANQYVLLPLQEQCEAFIEQVSLLF